MSPQPPTPKSVTVGIDGNEQNKILFPPHILWRPGLGYPTSRIKILQKEHRFDKGDYRLEKWPSKCVIERKCGLRELYTNLCTPDRTRAMAAFTRFATCDYPVLMVEGSLSDFWSKNEWYQGTAKVTVDPGVVWHELVKVANELGLHLWFAGRAESTTARRTLGEAMIRMMLYHALEEV